MTMISEWLKRCCTDPMSLDILARCAEQERRLLSVVALTNWPFDKVASEFMGWVEREKISDPMEELGDQIERYKWTGNPAAFKFYSHPGDEQK